MADLFGTLAPRMLPDMFGRLYAQRSDGAIQPGGPPGKIGPGTAPEPWTAGWLAETLLGFTPYGAAQGLAEFAANPGQGGEQGLFSLLGLVPPLRALSLAARAPAGVQNASRNPMMFDPPRGLPQRPFAADYPQGARADAAGRLTHDIDGRPLAAERVVGRRVVGGDDWAIPPAELNALAERITGTVPASVPPRVLRGDAGRYREAIDPETGNLTRAIELNRSLTPKQAPRVLAHETGHAIDERAGQIPTDGIGREIRGVYNTLNTGQTRTRHLTGPEHQGYTGAAVPRELMGEAIRAYMADPNYLKTVAPQAAARVREHVNSHPSLSRTVQFNSLLPPAAITFGMLAPPLPEQNPWPWP